MLLKLGWDVQWILLIDCETNVKCLCELFPQYESTKYSGVIFEIM